jgi:hypothetical protein
MLRGFHCISRAEIHKWGAAMKDAGLQQESY